MTNEATKVSPEEIAQYRLQFAGLPAALDALDLIADTDGDLLQATSLLIQEEGFTTSRGELNSLDELVEKCRRVICDEAFNELMTGLLSAAVGTLAASGQIPAALATPVVIYIARIGVKKFCPSGEKNSNTQ